MWDSNIPIVLIIGRQNVGKSTLFNRLIGYKKSIVHSIPGVTRDIVTEVVNFKGINFLLCDSGGLTDDKDITNKLVQKKTAEMIDKAKLILFVVDISTPHLYEKEYLKIFKKNEKKVILVANKADTPEKDFLLNEFYNYGIKELIPISAAHNRNIELLKSKIVENLKILYENYSFNKQEFKKENIIKIAIIGRPNVGKSSLLNKILNKERSIVSEIPGTTRDIVDDIFHFNNRNFLIIDTAGIRKKNKVKEDVEYYSVNRAIKSISMSDIIYFLIDSTTGISEQDKKIVDQIFNSYKPMLVLLNKWDLQEDNQLKKFKEVKEFILFKFPQLKFAPIIPISALTGLGVNKVLKETIKIYDETFKRIETSKLNEFVETILKTHSPSSKKGFLKVYYATQTGVKPPEFVFFVNRRELIPEYYENYIINKLREHFGFYGIPIKIVFKES